MAAVSTEYRVMAGISYLFWPLSLIIVLTNYKKDRYLRYHGYQSLYFGICCTVCYLVVGGFMQMIPFIGVLFNKAVLVFWFLFIIYLFYRCLQGDLFRIPMIYDLAHGVME